MTAPFEAGLIVPVPEAEPLVGEYRQRYDRSAALGVPAHITINYPFKPHVTHPREALSSLRSLLAPVREFTFTLAEIRTFPGILYLAPDPPHPFLTLIGAVVSRFPDSPPYGGEFGEPVPHLTVADVQEAELPSVHERFAAFACPLLPLAARAREIWLMDNSETTWKTRAVFPLRPLERAV